MSGKYILDGKKAVLCEDLITWAKWMEETPRRHVADNNVNGIRVSTIFLSIDHQFGGGPPLLFETLVFGGPLHHEMERYSTWEEAEKGHAEMVAKVQATFNKRG